MSEWDKYLAKGLPPLIYHMCYKQDYDQLMASKTEYFPPTFAADGGFVHATEKASFLISVANNFYKSTQGEWVCLQLNPLTVGGPVIYEAPAPVGGTPSIEHAATELFPHIYGGIPARAVIRAFTIERSADGSFLSIPGLVA